MPATSDHPTTGKLPGYAAVVLAGGQGRRMGGVHKPGISVAGASMLDRVLAAVRDAVPRIVVGPPQPVPPGVLLTRESPPGGGPVAGIAAGIAALAGSGDEATPPGLVAVLAADQPLLSASAVRALRRAVAEVGLPEPAGTLAGAAFLDGDRPQLLCGIWRLATLRDRLAAVPDPRGVAVRHLFTGLGVIPVRIPDGVPPWYDCDTEADLRTAESWLRKNTHTHS